MKHDHPIAAGEVTPGRCRLCSANDLDAVIEQLAEDLWESRREAGPMDIGPWATAGSYWHHTFRDFAVTAIEMLK